MSSRDVTLRSREGSPIYAGDLTAVNQNMQVVLLRPSKHDVYNCGTLPKPSRTREGQPRMCNL